MWVARRGATLLIPSGPARDPDRMHLHIVLTDPAVTDEVLIASVCTIPASNLYDSSCTFFPGEHPFIKFDSYVEFYFARIVNATQLEAQVAAGDFVAKADLEPKRIDDACVGVEDSPHSSPKVKRFFAANK
jgi:hypothetical protein